MSDALLKSWLHYDSLLLPMLAIERECSGIADEAIRYGRSAYDWAMAVRSQASAEFYFARAQLAALVDPEWATRHLQTSEASPCE